ncbi:hypothetical protein BAE44_0006848 [Dichanthelium oligosanthes]|uniref:Uncharacterized protein n=1 Tax=Dichanthelium oligosanthes TaxID=888268 RepID=A0A1E5W421_9POAL|nr:hypothetical protein BAE44_0006848 [Dichanthelium oligosanthes]
MALPLMNLLRVWPGPPAEQPVQDLRAAKSAIFVGVVNVISFASPSCLHHCLCCDGAGNVVERRYYLYQLANFVTAVLGVALLGVHMAFSAATVFSSPLLPPVLQWTIWLAKVFTGGTLQFGLHVLHFCLGMLVARFTLVSA